MNKTLTNMIVAASMLFAGTTNVSAADAVQSNAAGISPQPSNPHSSFPVAQKAINDAVEQYAKRAACLSQTLPPESGKILQIDSENEPSKWMKLVKLADPAYGPMSIVLKDILTPALHTMTGLPDGTTQHDYYSPAHTTRVSVSYDDPKRSPSDAAYQSDVYKRSLEMKITAMKACL